MVAISAEILHRNPSTKRKEILKNSPEEGKIPWKGFSLSSKRYRRTNEKDDGENKKKVRTHVSGFLMRLLQRNVERLGFEKTTRGWTHI